MTDINASKGDSVLLPFSQIPKELTKLVNNRLHSNVTFLLRKSLSIEESISISYDSKINLHLDQFERIYGHKEIIEVNSRYFESMFHSGLKESIRGEIIIEGIEYDVFLQVLYHLYGGQAKFTHDNCIPLLRIADKFCIDSLKLACELYIGNYAEIDDDLIDLVVMYNATRLSSLWKIRDIFILDEDYGEVNRENNGEITFF
jgi:hypothetical protein